MKELVTQQPTEQLDETTILTESDSVVLNEPTQDFDQSEAGEQDSGSVKSSKNVRISKIQEFFTARRMAYIAIFTAISLALRFLQFTILPAVSFLKFDFSDAIIMICAYALGPTAGLISCVLKEVIYGFFSQSAFIGELANIIVVIPYILIPSIMYKKHKGIKSVILWLSVACVVRTAWSFPVNMFLTFPAFLGSNWPKGMSMFLDNWHWVTLFNLIKVVILSVLVMLLYKSVSKLIHMLNDKFDELRERKSSKE